MFAPSLKDIAAVAAFTIKLASSSFQALPDLRTLVPQELSPKLSSGARTIFPEDAEFTNATTRWSAAIHPEFDVVIAVAQPLDIQEIVSTNFSPLR